MGWFDWIRGRAAEPDGLRAWRQAWTGAVAAPGPDVLARLGAELDALGLPEESIEIEREMLDGLRALCELGARIGTAGLPLVETGHRVVGTDRCHFSAPASMPDEPAQPSGRLLLTSRRAAFAGAGGRALPWHLVSDAIQLERDLILVARGQDQPLRFRCNSYADALLAARIARHLVSPRQTG